MTRTAVSAIFLLAYFVPSLPAQQPSESTGQFYQLKSTPKTVVWGYYDAKTPPVLRIKSGDTVWKYGHDIGKAIANMGKGENVHVHNLKTKRW